MSPTLLTVAVMASAGVSAGGLAALSALALSRGTAAYGSGYSARTSRAMEDLFLFVPPRKLAERAAVCAVAAALLVFALSGGVSGNAGAIVARAVLALCCGAAALAAPSRAVTILRARRRAKFELQFEGALMDMGNALRSGFSIMQAMEHVANSSEAPLSEEFAATLHQTRVGVPFEDALRNMAARVGSEDLSLAVLAVETARKTGGNLAEIFDSISATIRARLRIKARVKTLTAQGRMQGIVLTIMPIALAFVLSALQPGLFSPFVHSAAGVATLGGAAVLLVLGSLAIRKIVSIDI